MEERIRERLLDSADLRALVGSQVDWNARPQGDALKAFSAITLQVVSDIPGRVYSRASDGWRTARVMIECWGSTHKRSRDVAMLVDRLLNGYRAGLPGNKVRVFTDARTGDTDEVAGTTVHRQILTIFVHYQP
ncbi:tail completion protein gp17 [Sphingomonas sanxanigenens]|uniref:DUF3168 domain-containing protein n=1 Tax=Sphingomonas sanxanigenens DSM 19645 = NX02 TaxID=1123269 RepID=W0AHP5_9SPHN|nr:DUF3168 domain-containing protein [Sphingomonas sanxanigenens]AHE57429.1 hypothetical protein NX02_29325 [Sphingomonas sanxanigenens DSM 19645 = NX02]